MLTTVPYSDAAGIHNIEWDAVSSVTYLLTFHIKQYSGTSAVVAECGNQPATKLWPY